MVLRKGQKLVSYIILEEKRNDVESYLFNMNDEEFDKAIKWINQHH